MVVAGNYEEIINQLREMGLSNCYHSFSGAGSNCRQDIIERNLDSIELDRFVVQNKTRIDFIKMDIEGAEPNALRGAEETIRRDRPALQICLYHSPEHLWEIPEYVKSLVPGYTFHIGHHGIIRTDTVLYATCKG